ncbi:hypothetical protein [Streptomyces vastus]|uniref:Uncharacterized protein n=1 Tax=Streptomyces vastus TaxID=285451 RepID=A0ABP6DH69_9ACTN
MRRTDRRERAPKTLAQLARRRLRAEIPALEEAFTDHHAFILARMLNRIDAIDADITAVDAQIADEVAPYAQAIARLAQIPDVNMHARSGPGRRTRRTASPGCGRLSLTRCLASWD